MGNSWINIVVILLVIGAPVLKQIVDHLERKKEARSIDQERDRRRRDALRTGAVVQEEVPRRPTPAQVNASDRLREIQAKRREVLERARQQAQTGTDIVADVAAGLVRAPSQARSTPPSQFAPSGQGASGTSTPPRPTPVPVRGPTVVSTPRQRPRPITQPAARVAPGATAPSTPIITPVSRRRSKHAALGEHDTVHRLVTDAEAGVTIEGGKATVTSKQLSGLDRNQWRRALVLQELLSPPLALRKNQDPSESLPG